MWYSSFLLTQYTRIIHTRSTYTLPLCYLFHSFHFNCTLIESEWSEIATHRNGVFGEIGDLHIVCAESKYASEFCAPENPSTIRVDNINIAPLYQLIHLLCIWFMNGNPLRSQYWRCLERQCCNYAIIVDEMSDTQSGNKRKKYAFHLPLCDRECRQRINCLSDRFLPHPLNENDKKKTKFAFNTFEVGKLFSMIIDSNMNTFHHCHSKSARRLMFNDRIGNNFIYVLYNHFFHSKHFQRQILQQASCNWILLQHQTLKSFST